MHNPEPSEKYGLSFTEISGEGTCTYYYTCVYFLPNGVCLIVLIWYSFHDKQEGTM